MITTTSGTVFCIQFARDESSASKQKIIISSHASRNEANEEGLKGTGDNSYHEVQEEKQVNNTTFKEMINFLENFDQNYHFVSNNCQSLAGAFYAKFAYISDWELGIDRCVKQKTPGFSRGKDNTIYFTCNVPNDRWLGLNQVH